MSPSMAASWASEADVAMPRECLLPSLPRRLLSRRRSRSMHRPICSSNAEYFGRCCLIGALTVGIVYV